MATTRSNSVSRALYTFPQAPTPSCSKSSNLPIRRAEPLGRKVRVRLGSKVMVEPQEGQTSSLGESDSISSTGFWQCGQLMCIAATPPASWNEDLPAEKHYEPSGTD